MVTARRSWFLRQLWTVKFPSCTPSTSLRRKWSSLFRAPKRGGMASTQIQGHEERLLVDARWRPSSLHQLGKGFSYWEIPGQSDQSRHAHHLASSLPGFESIGFSFLGGGAAASVSRTPRDHWEPDRLREEFCCKVWQFSHWTGGSQRREESKALSRLQRGTLAASP